MMISPEKKCVKDKIPKALREQVWVNFIGKKFHSKCYVPWCRNDITVFDFQVGHNYPESKGGATILENLRPICSRCNLSMYNNYTIDEWSLFGKPAKTTCFTHFFSKFY
jgi:5-methylcytosine-specific restriction endonuclease McrA